MSVLLFKLNGVPDDEAEDIRRLLDENELSYYETNAGKWGISTAAIWLIDEGQLQQAHILIGEYEKERMVRVRKEFEQLKSEGKSDTILGNFIRHPVQFIIYVVVIALVFYVSLKPFIAFGN